jgi:prolipoprotein diacylglyceryltransferase
VAGATLGSKILFWFEDPPQTLQNLHNPAYLAGGKTIVGALIFGLIAVELMKRYIGLQISTGDLYALPLALGIAIGRIGCFLTGISDNTYGTPTTLPWGIDFGDGVRRHPTQLYEIAFLLALIPLLYLVTRRALTLSVAVAGSKVPAPAGIFAADVGNSSGTLATRYSGLRIRPGDAFKVFMVAYMGFRFCCDFIKPYPHLFLGLGAIQWACVFVLLYYSPDILRWLRAFPQRKRPSFPV